MNRVKEIRNKKDLTLLDLAKKTDIATSDISQIENGKKFPYPGWRKRLSEALEVPEKELFPEIDKE
ncbi:helix-turn-helix domain-containing protein [Halothermothrix orenii]|uniref:helix-turn-helix domain-containing protein n=1 Tax=Halothermothrix orenii TaxID=31909 RepID=UPI0002EDE5F5|nr:helix-turn-helix transcriptional regulator [Halothermothrix orenii]